MRKKKNMSPGKTIDCKIDIPPRGCSGIFPYDGCENPALYLDDVVSISCEGIISGRVLCDYQPLQGVTVALRSSFSGLYFENAAPVTDSTGRFQTRVTVNPGTPITPNVMVSATAVVIGRTIRDSISIRVDCIECKNPLLTLNPIPSEVGCQGTAISGKLICDGRAIGGALIHFVIDSASKRVFVTLDPAVTMSDGTYKATLFSFPEVEEEITTTATTEIGGGRISSETRETFIRCHHDCKDPVITLDKIDAIECSSNVKGRVTCDGVPLPNVSVSLSGSSILEFQPQNPVTDQDGVFSSTVMVEEGTSLQRVTYSASAVIDGKPVNSSSNTASAYCDTCSDPVLTLEGPGVTVDCEGAALRGMLTCNGEPLAGVPIFFTLPTGVGELQPNPAMTDERGRYVTILIPNQGEKDTFTVKATAKIGDTPAVAIAVIDVDCVCVNPSFQLDMRDILDCKGIISGYLLCEGEPLVHEEVTFSSPVLSFNPTVVRTDADGAFSSLAVVPPDSPFREVPFTVAAYIGGKTVSEVVFVYAGCKRCDKPKLTLCVPDCMNCEGGKVTGQLTCHGTPVKNTRVTIQVVPHVVTIIPEIILTNEQGEYEARLIPYANVSQDVSIRASAVVHGTKVTSETESSTIHCPCRHPVIELDYVSTIDCCGRIGGTVLCDGIPVPDIDIELDSPILEFEKKMVTTNEQGRFSSEVTVPEDTDFQEIPYTARANVSGEAISAKGFVYGGCLLCEDPDISLRVPLCIDCKGATITGKVLCDDIPLEGVKVFFEVMEKDLKKIIQPNPAVTNASGKYSARITPVHGMDHCLTLRAGILWGGRKIYTKPSYTIIECTC